MLPRDVVGTTASVAATGKRASGVESLETLRALL